MKNSDSPKTRRRKLPHQAGVGLMLLGILLSVVVTRGAETSPSPVRGADELFWVPTLEQALAMAAATSKPIFVMGYSLVGDGSTYTKLGAEFCTGVF